LTDGKPEGSEIADLSFFYQLESHSVYFFEHIQDQTVLGGGSFLMHSIKSSDFMQKAKKLSFFRRHPRPFSSASLFRGPICFCVDDAGQMGTVKISWIQVSHADLGIR
jgi:hypothetical protein